ncbi:Hsp33 family molecular chaperone HslO [Pseudomonas sp. 10B1]|uniref:Hsp33 family molecular chaperone HslO n=1 Tax=unclassified Pseudomonas TaxID=196821 RepID=UPI002AB3D821|nr:MULTISPECIES: Hsp33 family molecular chaperone HslO [unclassified Pseudomonas]MDY7562295.1 Hsp33 family molecular chaperone HslO [Pseudomonas sp. AB6]MEA9976329.1 Hsp33 family molecular chaperone HslO [Pseudomonas sp. RTS4]MEA9994782.1 Hsp33 family molecular chaperone HslO [Pseudomonas sp. AA4]MEB0086445.1 Hsp33 family molecular chaperone HslO [Pseudomonas sp. RTI1]MEB0126356.1 Hsp33 family molecular chaperone HslO [Pseudomonas sp. CCC1.2]
MHDFPDIDYTQRFIFDESDVRGELVTLERSYAEVLAKHPYPEPVAQLLGEMLAAASLLVGTLKFDGLLVLQANSSGAVPMLMVECSSDREIRGIARYEEDQIVSGAGLRDLMPDGILTLTIDPRQGKRYQGAVALDGADLSESLTSYFALSEQLGTRFWLSADGSRARGLLLQQLPADRLTDPEDRDASWQHVTALAGTLTAEELLSLDNETVLHRLFHEDAVRMFDIQPLQFRCSCSRERSANALVSLGEEDAQQLVIEHHGAIEIDCQFCNQRYLFDATDVAQIFAGGGVDSPSNTRH